jgi:hypothetical protein
VEVGNFTKFGLWRNFQRRVLGLKQRVRLGNSLDHIQVQTPCQDYLIHPIRKSFPGIGYLPRCFASTATRADEADCSLVTLARNTMYAFIPTALSACSPSLSIYSLLPLLRCEWPVP